MASPEPTISTINILLFVVYDGFYLCLRKFFGFLNGEPPAKRSVLNTTPADGSNTFDPDGSLWHYDRGKGLLS